MSPSTTLLFEYFFSIKNDKRLNHFFQVDIIYKGEVLPTNFSLMDVAYTFKWKRVSTNILFFIFFTYTLRIKSLVFENFFGAKVDPCSKSFIMIFKTLKRFPFS